MFKKYRTGIGVASLLGAAFFSYIYYGETGLLPISAASFPFLIASIVISNFITFIIFSSNSFLNHYLPWKKNTSIRLLSGIIVQAFIIVFVSLLSAFFIVKLFGFSTENLIVVFREPLIKLVIIGLISSMIYSIIYFALYSYNQYAVVQIENVRHERKQVKLQFEALKSQLSPHYLFNCLNTVSSLVYKDSEAAELFIRQLAQTYQYILNTNRQKLVRLQDEVDFVKSYFYLLRVRFETSFDLHIDLPSNFLESYLPPLTLQILVENAVKHNIFSKEEPLEVFIKNDDSKHIIVSNTKTSKPAEVTSFKVGLSNIRYRYEFFTDARVEVIDQQDFTVKLPLLTHSSERNLEQVA